MLISVAGLAHIAVQAVFSKIGGVIAVSIISHIVILRAKAAHIVAAVKDAEEKAKAELRAKYDEIAEAIRAEAEHDELVVKATIAKVEADVRKIF